MWTCAPCGTANEPHAIFCAACGAMRYKAPIREALLAAEPAPLPAPARPEFRGSAAGFAAAWLFASVGGALGASLIQHVMSIGLRFSGNPDSWALTFYRLGWGIAFGFLYGGIVGAVQARVLSRRVSRPGWRGWIVATMGGTVCVSVAAQLVPMDFWTNDTLGGRVAMGALVGLIGGGFVGLLQSRVLSRVLGPGGWSAWWLISAGAIAAGNVAGSAAWQLVFDPVGFGAGSAFLAGFAHTACDTGLIAILTGLPLARMLRRRCAPGQD